MKTKKQKLTEHLDWFIAIGGTWEQIEQKGNTYAKHIGLRTTITPNRIKTQIKSRRKLNINYLNKLIMLAPK